MLEARALRADASACESLSSVRIGQVPRDREAGADHRVEEGLPAGAGGTFVAIGLGLLEG